MPLTAKGQKIKSAMTKEYGAKKGEQVFYASRNKGIITGVDPESGGGRSSTIKRRKGNNKRRFEPDSVSRPSKETMDY